MYNILKPVLLRFLKVQPEPTDPMGDVSKLLVFRASPNYFRYKRILWLISLPIGLLFGAGLEVALIVAAVAGQGSIVSFLIALAAILLAIFIIFQVLFSYTMLRLDYEMRWYKVTDRSLRIREGVWRMREMTMMFDNIQNISITQGPIQRMLNIADLKVQTAGGSTPVPQQGHQAQTFDMHTGYFRGIDNAQEILALMQSRLRNARTAGLGDEAPHEIEPVAPQPASDELISAARQLLEEARAFRAAATGIASVNNQ